MSIKASIQSIAAWFRLRLPTRAEAGNFVRIITDGVPASRCGSLAIAAWKSIPKNERKEEQPSWFLLVITAMTPDHEPRQRHEIENALRAERLPLPLSVQFCRPVPEHPLSSSSDPLMIGRLATGAESTTAHLSNNPIFPSRGSHDF